MMVEELHPGRTMFLKEKLQVPYQSTIAGLQAQIDAFAGPGINSLEILDIMRDDLS